MASPIQEFDDDLAARYPQHRARRWVLIGISTVLGALLFSWMIWAGVQQATPAVVGRVKAWTIRSDTQTDVLLTVDRRHPNQAVRCSVFAQSANFERVGELTVDVPAATTRIVDVPITLKTFRRATSVSYDKCVVA